ncbi:Sugar-binding protein OS=Streptomyces microflavus OX=1919 GN=Smic_24830 PE=3 SV=1 [Streptomyces microflavus]
MQLEGFDIDLVRALAKDILGDPNAVIFRAIPTNQRIAALDRHGSTPSCVTMHHQLQAGDSLRPDRLLPDAGQQILGAPRTSSLITGSRRHGLPKGTRVCSGEGTTAYEALEKESYGAIFKDESDGTERDRDQPTVPNQLDCLVRLQLGEVDAVLTDNALGAGQAAQDPAVALKGAGPFTTDTTVWRRRRVPTTLVARVNKVLVDYRAGGADSAWMVSYRKWLAAGLPGITAPPAPKYRSE